MRGRWGLVPGLSLQCSGSRSRPCSSSTGTIRSRSGTSLGRTRWQVSQNSGSLETTRWLPRPIAACPLSLGSAPRPLAPRHPASGCLCHGALGVTTHHSCSLGRGLPSPPVIVRPVSLWSRVHIRATPGCIVCVSSRPGSTSKDAGLTTLGPDSETPMHRQSGDCGLAQGSAGLLSALCHPRGLSPERVPCGHLESPALSTPTLPGQSLLSGQPGLAAARSPHWLSAALTITPRVPGPSLCTSHQPLWFLRPPCTVLFATPKHLGACGSHLLRSPSLPLPAPQH